MQQHCLTHTLCFPGPKLRVSGSNGRYNQKLRCSHSSTQTRTQLVFEPTQVLGKCIFYRAKQSSEFNQFKISQLCAPRTPAGPTFGGCQNYRLGVRDGCSVCSPPARLPMLPFDAMQGALRRITLTIKELTLFFSVKKEKMQNVTFALGQVGSQEKESCQMSTEPFGWTWVGGGGCGNWRACIKQVSKRRNSEFNQSTCDVCLRRRWRRRTPHQVNTVQAHNNIVVYLISMWKAKGCTPLFKWQNIIEKCMFFL